VRVACFCGTVFDTDTAGQCPYCGETVLEDPRSEPEADAGDTVELEDAELREALYREASHEQLAVWRVERRQIVESYEWAFAMGHGCSMSPKHPTERDLIARKHVLDALIAEHAP
jgi:hypothetical protein